MKTSTKTLYVPNPKVGYWSKPETKKPKMEEHHMEDGEDADEEERFPNESLVSRWEILEPGVQGHRRAALVPRGSGLTLGRHPSCDICVETSSVSARHCVITCLTGSKRDSLILRDLSSNGTYVNGIHLKDGEELGLSDGDVITLAARDGKAFEVRLCQVKKCEENGQAKKAQNTTEVSGVKRPAQATAGPTCPPFAKRRLRRKTKDPSWLPKDEEMVAPEQMDEEAQEPSVEEVAAAVLQAKGDGGPRLVDLTSGEVYYLPAQGCLSIGRRADCEVVIPRSVVSGRHCVLTCAQGCVQVEDESSNGTFVNETQVPKGFSLPQRIPLRDGDHIYLAQRDGPALLFLTGEDDEEDEDD